MHEIHLLKDILNKIDSIATQQGSNKVEKVKIWLGALSHISGEHLIEHFVEESKGRLCEGAAIEVESSNDMRHPQAQEIILESVDVTVN